MTCKTRERWVALLRILVSRNEYAVFTVKYNNVAQAKRTSSSNISRGIIILMRSRCHALLCLSPALVKGSITATMTR